jgi:hypothetical protein
MNVYPSPVPRDPGCLSIHVKTTGGAPVQCTGNAPASLSGAHWAAAHGWQVFFWRNGVVFRCRHLLITEGERKPCDLKFVMMHLAEHQDSWEIIKMSVPLS